MSDCRSERLSLTSGWIQNKLGNLQWQWCAGAAPRRSVNLLTHTGSIMSLPLSLLPPTLRSYAPSLSLSLSPAISLPSAFSRSLLLPLPVSNCSTPVFLFCISQQSAGQAAALNSSTSPCPACLSVYLSVSPSTRLHQEPLPRIDWRQTPRKRRCVQLLEKVTSNSCNYIGRSRKSFGDIV